MIDKKPKLHTQYQTPPQVFDAYNKQLPVQEALGTNRIQGKREAADIRSVNWIPGVSGWRLTPRGLELGDTTGVLPAGSVTLSMIQNISTARILGRTTAGTGVTEQLTVAQVITMLALVAANISDFNEASQDAVGGILTDTATIDFTYNDGANTITADIIKVIPRVVSMTDATSFTPTADTADINTQTNTQAIGTLTANAPSGTPLNGQTLELVIKSTNVQTFSWNAIYVGCTTTALPTATTGATKTDKFFFQYNTGVSKWQIYSVQYGYT